ncbi:MAG TPA: efflux RND transporter periplasmic adaptor subunit, partial [Deltaproteobacteria bacterium]|nr:efflux RND transporter periplasmic adaptor subunit [Deltaproteobacteria bacterium]
MQFPFFIVVIILYSSCLAGKGYKGRKDEVERYRMKKGYYILTAIVVVVALILWQIFLRTPQMADWQDGQHRLPVAVEVAPVMHETIMETGTYTGTLLPKSRFVVAPKIAGRLKKIMVDIGDEVANGSLVAVLADDEYVQQVDQARAELDVARANIEENHSTLNLKKREFERAKTLRAKKIVSESELDAAQTQYEAAVARQKVVIAQAAQKEAELKSAQVRLDYTRISAHWEDGRHSRYVSERFIDEGAMLSANTPIVSIIDIDTLKAVIYVIERDYPRVRSGQASEITTDAYPGRTFSGIIDRIAPVLKEAARQARVEIAIVNPDKILKPGMFVRVKIEYDRHENATIVPVGALIKIDGQPCVFLADTDMLKARLVAVDTGIISDDRAEIVDPVID